MKDKIYPAFYESIDDDLYLYMDSKNYYCLSSGKWEGVDKADTKDHESDDNMTREYLKNTWGIVESKEHAKFIVGLAKNAEFGCEDFTYDDGGFFYTDESDLYFTSSSCVASNGGEKEITIPLPPKSKEWTPEVGDEVCYKGSEKSKGVVLAFDGGVAWVKDCCGGYSMLQIKNLVKPKSAQELKIEELQTKLCENNAVDNYILACDIVMGNIEGLSYE